MNTLPPLNAEKYPLSYSSFSYSYSDSDLDTSSTSDLEDSASNGEIDTHRTADQLIADVRSGDIKFLKQWFEQGFFFDLSMQQDVLIVCCETGNCELLKFLLEKHHSKDPFTSSPLSDYKKQKLWDFVAERHSMDIAALLLNSGLSTLLSNGTNIALQCAIVKKNHEMMILLKEFGPLDAKGISSNALRELAKDENVLILKFLIENDFDLNHTYPEKELPHIPLMLAVKYSIFLDEIKSHSLFQLALGSTLGPQKQVIKLLLNNGVIPNQWINEETAISFAVALQDIELIKMLLAKGAGSDIKIKDDTGATALTKARLTKNQEILNLLDNELAC